MAVDKLKYSSGNSASTTLSSSVSDSDTSAPLTSDTNFSAKSGEGMVIIGESTANEEFAYATGKSGASLTIPLVNRGLEGSAAASHSATDTVKGIFTSGMWNDLIDSLLNVLDKTTGAVSKTLYSTLNAPEGFLINGLIVPSVASNNLTVAIKGMDGNDPSATNPVYCRIGGVVRSITAALSGTWNAGANWFNSGSAELATKEVDYFVYLVYKTGGTVDLGVSRIPYGTLYSDFSATGTNEKGFNYGVAPAPDAGNQVVNIGRFAATLSAGAGYTWTVPTFTATNLIQRPIYETRWLSYVTVTTASGGGTFTLNVRACKYKIVGRITYVFIDSNSHDVVGTVDAVIFTLPLLDVSDSSNGYHLGVVGDSLTQVLSATWSDGNWKVQPVTGAWTATTEGYLGIKSFYEI
jgi:hypothetical protein